MMKNIILCLILIFSVLLLAPSTIAAYYADIRIDINEEGYARISGDTNHPGLVKPETMEFTQYEDGRFLLNITIPDNFSSYIYELTFPEGAKINYLKTPKLARINDDADTIKIIGTGSNQPFVIIAQYSIEEKRELNLMMPFAIAGLIMISLAGIMILRSKKKSAAPKYNRHALTERQQMIVDMVEKNKGMITQSAIEKATKLPKSSISRNVESLVRRGILKKEQKGMTNLIFFEKK